VHGDLSVNRVAGSPSPWPGWGAVPSPTPQNSLPCPYVLFPWSRGSPSPPPSLGPDQRAFATMSPVQKSQLAVPTAWWCKLCGSH